jgi:hypothetical protein
MKHNEPRPYADPAAAAKRIMEIANSTEAIDGRIHIEKINRPMLMNDKASPPEYWAGLQYTIDRGWLNYQESGTYVAFTSAGADLFA